MQSRLRDTTHQLMKALEAFYPFVKNAEEQVGILESDVANLTERKRTLDSELGQKIKNFDALIAADKKKIQDKLDQATLLCEQAQEVYFELYKAKLTKIVPPAGYGDKLAEKINGVAAKVKEAKDKAAA